MEQLQKVLKYSRTFKEEYGVTCSVSIIHDIFDHVKYSQYILEENSMTKIYSTEERYSRIAKFIRHSPSLMDFLTNLLHASYGAEDLNS